MVVDTPVPVIAPGLIVQFPVGRPDNITLHVTTVHEGWVITPTVGAVGVAGAAAITILADAAEVQPAALVTV